MKVCIIGAGPTGLGAAYRLTELGETDFRVFERDDHVGGLAASFLDDKGFTWDFGVHVVHSHYPYFDKLLDSVLPDGYLRHQRRSWIRQYDRFIPYPFQYNIRHLPRQALWDCVSGLLDIVKHNGEAPPANFEEWVVYTFGAGIAEHFMLPYNRKIWTVDPSEMGFHWIEERVPVIDIRRVLSNVVLATDDVTWGPNHTFRFPREEGTGAIWNAMAGRLPPETVRLSHEVAEIDTDRKELRFANGNRESYEHLISTIPLPRLVELCKMEKLAAKTAGLKHTRVQVLGVAPDYPMPQALADKSWIYCPSEKSAFYRLTPFSTFSPAHVPSTDRFCSILIERALPADSSLGEEEFKAETFAGLEAGGFLTPLDENTHTCAMEADYAYPVPTRDRDSILDQVLPALEALRIYSRGRFGAWKYEVANMDHCVMQGVEIADRIVSGTPEKTLPNPGKVNGNSS